MAHFLYNTGKVRRKGFGGLKADPTELYLRHWNNGRALLHWANNESLPFEARLQLEQELAICRRKENYFYTKLDADQFNYCLRATNDLKRHSPVTTREADLPGFA